MPPVESTYLFLLGVASGIAGLSLTAYRTVTPSWLKGLLLALGVFVISRYVTMAVFASRETIDPVWALRHCWFATSIGLTLPSVFAVDHLVRHPAITPRKLLRWYAPFFLAYTGLILFAPMTPVTDRIAGWMPQLGPGWRWGVSITHTIFLVGFVSICLALMRKIPSRSIRLALLCLVLAHLYLGVDGVLLALDRWYVRPFLYSEMLALLAIWRAFQVGTASQQ